jgi:steroid delta-isomerase-like uncharacterized protein
MSNVERNKAQFKKLIDEVINTGKLDGADALLAPDRPDYQQWGLPPDALKGPEGFKRIIGVVRNAFPDLHFTSEYMIGEGDKVLSYNTIEGTHRGDFMGVPATGKHFKASAADICSFDAQGKISAHWGVFDVFGMMVQLGAVPPPGAPKR